MRVDPSSFTINVIDEAFQIIDTLKTPSDLHLS